MIAKVGIEIEMERGETLARHLWTYDKQSSMADNIKKIVLHHNSDQVEPLVCQFNYEKHISSCISLFLAS